MVFFRFIQLFKYSVHGWAKRQRSAQGCTGNIPYVPRPSKLLLLDFKASVIGHEEDRRQCWASPQAAEDIYLLALAAGVGHSSSTHAPWFSLASL